MATTAIAALSMSAAPRPHRQNGWRMGKGLPSGTSCGQEAWVPWPPPVSMTPSVTTSQPPRVWHTVSWETGSKMTVFSAPARYATPLTTAGTLTTATVTIISTPVHRITRNRAFQRG